jgi:two-component system, OmpR family, KDP operon response regulator KdpE
MSNACVLMADNRRLSGKFLKDTLTAQDYDIVEAVKGQEAFAKTATDKYGIVLDTGLPDVNGIEVTGLLCTWIQVLITIFSVAGGVGGGMRRGIPQAVCKYQ